MPAPLLEVCGLSRSYGPIRAVQEISFELAEGELLALFGPNGAGKSTLLGVLGGALPAQSGEILFRGQVRDPGATEWRREIGLLSHRSFLYPVLTARENLTFYGRLYALPDLAERVQERLAEVELTEAADRPMREFSRGMHQRLALARTLLHDPAFILLDEPFTGLDVHASARLRELLLRLKDGKRTILLVTHNLGDGLALADRVAIQVAGRFAFLGGREEIPSGDEEAFYRGFVDGGGRP